MILLKRTIAGLGIALIATLFLLLMYLILSWYVDPASPTEKTAMTQSFFSLITGLISGAIVGGGGLILSWRNLQQSEENTRETLRTTHALEEERAQAATLQSYLQLMATLLSDPDARGAGHTLARAQSLATLEVLNPRRKRILLQFLYESNLILAGEEHVVLSRANLSAADLKAVNLAGADLRGVNLRGADLRGADLTDAILTDAILTDADRTDAWVTNEQLANCESLKGATMPNGQKYKDWLIDKEGSGKDVENE